MLFLLFVMFSSYTLQKLKVVCYYKMFICYIFTVNTISENDNSVCSTKNKSKFLFIFFKFKCCIEIALKNN